MAPREPNPPGPAALERRLATAAKRWHAARAKTDQAAEERDVLILEATAAGVSRRRVAELADITPGAVQQILERRGAR